MTSGTKKSRLGRPTWASDDGTRAAAVAESFLASLPLDSCETDEQKRAQWKVAGEAGLLCNWVPTEYGGMGVGRDVLMMTLREQVRFGHWWFGNSVHSGVVPEFLLSFGTEAQKLRYLPGMATGECVAAFALTEPAGGSNLSQLTTYVETQGSSFIMNGEKSFVTNGMCADVVLVAAVSRGYGVGLFLVDADKQGVTRISERMGVGQQSSDLATYYFDDVKLDASDLLVNFDIGLPVILDKLSWERLLIAVMAVAAAEFAIRTTHDSLTGISRSGRDLLDVAGVKTTFAECKIEYFAAKCVVNKSVADYFSGSCDLTEIAVSKYLATETAFSVSDRCVQLHGASGCVADSVIGELMRDCRPPRIYGGANEVLKEIALQLEP